MTISLTNVTQNDVWGSGGIASQFLASAQDGYDALQPLYPRGNRPRYSLDGRLCGLQGRSGLCGDEKNLLLLPAIEPWPPACSPSLYRLIYPGSHFLDAYYFFLSINNICELNSINIYVRKSLIQGTRVLKF
jgi:hypothetical protein